MCASRFRLCGHYSKDVDLFRLACVRKQKAKEEVIMTVRKAKKQLAAVIRHYNLESDSFTIKKGRLISKNGVMNIPVCNLAAIIPAHGTVMAIFPMVM